MTRKTTAAGTLLLLACGFALAQQVPPISSPSAPGVIPPVSFTPPLPPPASPSSPKPDDLSIDQLIDSVENLRMQKADLEKKEKELLLVIQRKTAQQKQRLEKLGVGNGVVIPIVPAPPSPASY